jgi:thiosulfate/3-mercaptopyruvate sulfurtransferase
VELVSIEWLDEHLGAPGVLVLDPRTRERYLSGHAAGVVHAPIREAFDGEGRLRGNEELAAWLGSRGVSRDVSVAVLDDYDGQKGSMLAWILEYLGHPDVKLLDAPFFARWKDRGGELFYRPVFPDAAELAISPRAELRASREDVEASAAPVLDVRSAEELEPSGDAAGGWIPGAVHLYWRGFVEDGERLFVPAEAALRLLEETGLGPEGEPILYCQSGPRAAAALIAMRRAGVAARLYDGSFLDWTRAGMPVESASGSPV